MSRDDEQRRRSSSDLVGRPSVDARRCRRDQSATWVDVGGRTDAGRVGSGRDETVSRCNQMGLVRLRQLSGFEDDR